MRYISVMLLLTISWACTGPKHSVAAANPLNGTWIPVKQEIGGKALPAAAYAAQKLVISDSNYIFTAESVDKGIARYNDGKMDIYGKEGVNKGKHFMAIYKLENGELSICYNLKGDKYPDGYDTKTSPLFFLSVFKKE